jgi:hypothetical protein
VKREKKMKPPDAELDAVLNVIGPYDTERDRCLEYLVTPARWGLFLSVDAL